MKLEGDSLSPAPRQTQVLQGKAPRQPLPLGASVSQPLPAQQPPGMQQIRAPYAGPPPIHDSWAAPVEAGAAAAGSVQHQGQVCQQVTAGVGQHQHAALPAPEPPARTTALPQDTQLRSSAAVALPAGHGLHGGPVQPSPPCFQPSLASLSEPQHAQQQAQQDAWAHQQAATKAEAGAAGPSAVASALAQPMQAALTSLPAPDTMATVAPDYAPQHRTCMSGEHGSAGQLPLHAKAEPVVAVLPTVSQATADPPSSPAPASGDVIDLSQTPDSDQSAGLTGALSFTCTNAGFGRSYSVNRRA